MQPAVTLQDLVSAVSEYAESEAELVATVVHMVRSGKVRLIAGPDLPGLAARLAPPSPAPAFATA